MHKANLTSDYACRIQSGWMPRESFHNLPELSEISKIQIASQSCCIAHTSYTLSKGDTSVYGKCCSPRCVPYTAEGLHYLPDVQWPALIVHPPSSGAITSVAPERDPHRRVARAREIDHSAPSFTRLCLIARRLPPSLCPSCCLGRLAGTRRVGHRNWCAFCFEQDGGFEER